MVLREAVLEFMYYQESGDLGLFFGVEVIGGPYTLANSAPWVGFGRFLPLGQSLTGY